MNHMDYVEDDSKLMLSTGQALRMQAIVSTVNGTAGPRESLKASPGLTPTVPIVRLGGTVPTVVYCNDQTPFRLNAGYGSAGCGGGSLRYQWAATNGWTIDDPTAYAPLITPTGNSDSYISLTGTYTNMHGHLFYLSTVTHYVRHQAQAAPKPVFTSGPASICAGSGGTYAVGPVSGATGYRWNVPPGFTPTGYYDTPGPSITIVPNANLAGGVYTLECRTLTSLNCAPSDPVSYTFIANGGPQLKIVDSDAFQNQQGLVCAQNRIGLRLVPVTPVPGFQDSWYSNVVWSVGAQNQATTPVANFPLEGIYHTPETGGTPFTVTALYTDPCGNRPFAVSYSATTAPTGTVSLGTGFSTYNCNTNQWRPAPTSPTGPYPNPAADMLQLPGYQGTVVVYNQQGRPVQSLLAPGTAAGAAVDTRTWPDGLYVVTGRNSLGEFERHTVQIQH